MVRPVPSSTFWLALLVITATLTSGVQMIRLKLPDGNYGDFADQKAFDAQVSLLTKRPTDEHATAKTAGFGAALAAVRANGEEAGKAGSMFDPRRGCFVNFQLECVSIPKDIDTEYWNAYSLVRSAEDRDATKLAADKAKEKADEFAALDSMVKNIENAVKVDLTLAQTASKMQSRVRNYVDYWKAKQIQQPDMQPLYTHIQTIDTEVVKTADFTKRAIDYLEEAKKALRLPSPDADNIRSQVHNILYSKLELEKVILTITEFAEKVENIVKNLRKIPQCCLTIDRVHVIHLSYESDNQCASF